MRRKPRILNSIAASAWLGIARLLALVALASSARASAEDPEKAAREVFQSPDFWWKRYEAREVSTSWLETSLWTILRTLWKPVRWVLSRLGDFLGWLLSHISFGFSGEAPELTLLIWLVILAILTLTLWRLYPVFMRWLRIAPTPKPRKAQSDPWDILPEASELFEQANQALRQGNHAEAVRLALLALIARLEKQGLLRVDSTRTNREYLRDLRDRPDLSTSFGRLARLYERIWYGRTSASRDQAEEAIRLSGSAIGGKELAPE